MDVVATFQILDRDMFCEVNTSRTVYADVQRIHLHALHPAIAETDSFSWSMLEQLEEDFEVLDKHHDMLGDEPREIVCDDGSKNNQE